MDLIFYFFCLIFSSFLLFSSSQNTFPHCKKYMDTFGQWMKISEVNNESTKLEFIRNHFIGNESETFEFSHVWVPENCSYHRFTNHSIIMATKYQIFKTNLTRPLHISFVGDSALRGIVCGIFRILSGSEIEGPCVNSICGGAGMLPLSARHTNGIRFNEVTPFFTISYAYTKTLEMNHGDYALENLIRIKPYAIFFASGAWDFDKIARNHMNETASEYCDTNETKEISERRASKHIKSIIDEMSGLSHDLNVRLIYRNNHFNRRFGVYCADEKFELLLEDTHWELWDNRRISKQVWESQCGDGFHFDRVKIGTKEHHQGFNKVYRDNNWELPGMLEIQLAQSALNLIYYDWIEHCRNQPDEYCI